MDRAQKATLVEEIAGQIEGSQAVFAVDYRGISVPDAADLRARLRDADAVFRVVKNSLTERAADRAGAESLRELLDGPTALTFVHGDAAVAAKALADFGRGRDILTFKGGLLDGEPVSTDEIKAISRLPARDVLFGQLVGTVSAPVTGLVRGLNGLLAGLASQLAQIAEGGLLPSAAEPEEPPPAEEAPAEAEEPAGAEEPAAEEPAAEEPAVGETDADDEPASPEQGEQEADEQADATAPADDEASREETAAGGDSAEA